MINNTGSVTNWNHGPNCPPNHRDPLTERYATLDVMFTDDLEDLVRTVETCAGLERKSETPATTDASIGSRVIAEMLGQNLHSRTHLRVRGFLYNNSRPRFDWSDQFKELYHHKLQDYNTYELQESWGQVSFIFEEREVRTDETEPDTPILAIEVSTGLTYTRAGKGSLTGLYDTYHHDISRTAFELLSRAKKDS